VILDFRFWISDFKPANDHAEKARNETVDHLIRIVWR
jgi:hypothetical protein